MFDITSSDGSFGVTSSILFKGLQIGEVIKKKIDNYNINYKVLIYEEYTSTLYLLQQNSIKSIHLN